MGTTVFRSFGVNIPVFSLTWTVDSRHIEVCPSRLINAFLWTDFWSTNVLLRNPKKLVSSPDEKEGLGDFIFANATPYLNNIYEYLRKIQTDIETFVFRVSQKR